MKVTLLSTLVATGIALATLSGAAQAKGRLVVYCSATNEMCETETKAFGDKYDVKTSFIRNGSGSTLAKVDAEKKTIQIQGAPKLNPGELLFDIGQVLEFYSR